jgi:hypothetical protein
LALRPGTQQLIVDTLLNAQVQQLKSDKKEVDGMLRGWSWVDGTFSWVEPTSYALLALKSTGLTAHARMREAERMLIDRTCTDGGWNYGSRLVRGADMTSMTSTTALAALALQHTAGSEHVVARAMDLLDREVQANPSGLSLALTILCFHAFGRGTQHLRERLAGRQLANGSWREQPHLTALAVLALRTGEREANVFKI